MSLDVQEGTMIMGPFILPRRRNSTTGDITLFKTCEVTGEEYSVTLPDQTFRLLMSPNCPLIQEALPDFTAEQREFLMTGITPAEWDKTFPPEDEG
jgi:hypothetical protein